MHNATKIITKGEHMNKPLILGLVGIVLVAALLVGVHAYGQQISQYQNINGRMFGAQGAQKGTCEFHEDMETILESGTYADLVALREESGKPMMPFVKDEVSFAAMQEQHKEMIANGNDFQAGTGCGMNAGKGLGTHQRQGLGKNQGNCPMMNN